MWALDQAAFKAGIKEPFKATTIDGIRRIIAYPAAASLSKEQLAYVLATVWHETAAWCSPIREGAARYGPTYSDASARAAVANLYAKGLITKNYALAHPVTRKSYYGRGLVQITWYDNYMKFGIADNPDKALNWDTALDITFRGMIEGMFRKGNSLSMIQSPNDWYAARNIINGDARKNGDKIARVALAFYNALSKA